MATVRGALGVGALSLAFMAVAIAVAGATGADFSSVATIDASAVNTTSSQINALATSGGAIAIPDQSGMDIITNFGRNFIEALSHHAGMAQDGLDWILS